MNISAHCHWVDALTLSTDTVLRFGALMRMMEISNVLCNRRNKQMSRSEVPTKRLVTESDDFTLMLWEALRNQCNASGPVKPKTRIIGHQGIGLIAVGLHLQVSIRISDYGIEELANLLLLCVFMSPEIELVRVGNSRQT